MKETLFLFLIALTIGVQAQVKKGFSLSLSSGITTPTGDYQKYTKLGGINEDLAYPIDYYGYTKERTGKSLFNIDASYQFGGLGMGLSFGKFKHEVSSLVYDIDFPTLIEGGEIEGLYYGIGPDYALSLGKLKMISSIRAGRMNIDFTNFTGSYNGEDAVTPVEILTTTQNPESETSLTYGSFGVKFSYPVLKKLNLFIKADYFSTFGDGLQVDDNYYLPFDVGADDQITIDDVKYFTLIDFEKKETRFIKPQMYNLEVGLSYTLGGNKKIKKPVKSSKIEPKEEPQQEEKARKILLTYPENGAQFKKGESFNKFKWKVVGKAFNNPEYIIEVKAISKRGKVRTNQTNETFSKASKLFIEEKASGQYVWRVVEKNTGESSDYKSFRFSGCEFTMTVNNVQVECIGYEGSDRKYKICFDITYSSGTGDLTYNDIASGSGLSVYDQSYVALAYNLVAPNTTLQSQIGANNTTVNYCFETLVDNTVSAIGFALQGDDLDPSPVTCQPGVSNGVEELPSCICDECDAINISFDNFNITSSNQNPSIFTFDGNINVNTPIYGLEFQILSLDYSSNPNTCSNGITSIENSGMFLQAGTSINNSSSIQFINESASQNPSSNNNASKNIKYLSNTALSTAIPVHLNIGLPQPIQGLDADCCQIDYELCMKVKVLYEDGTCKICTLTKCFSFNNQ